jgi:glutathione S-transferase
MKLYYSPGACSLAPHIVLREAGNKFELVKVDFESKTTETGGDFTKINPHGYVPALALDNNEILTEGVAIMQYIADQAPDKHLVPANGTFERARLQERLNYLTTELHKSFGPLFSDSPEAEKQKAIARIESKLDYLDKLLADRLYLLGDEFSVADAYLFVLASWTKPTGIGLSKWPNIAAYSDRIAERENVRDALQAEGLLN